MTPKEKAKELVDKMYNSPYVQELEAKRCALIAVDELIKYSEEWDDSEYWFEVKQEIEKL